VLVLVLALAPVYLLGLLYYGGSPTTLNAGYQPEQPVAYSHALHAGDLGIDCRYCHNAVEEAAGASVPPTSTCMNCHSKIFPDSEKLQVVRDSYRSGLSIPWVRVHDLPDYVYFNHSAHVTRGVGCVDCHGRVDKMEVVYQQEPLSMGWCLDCHRNPEEHLRDPALITDMAWNPGEEERLAIGARIRQQYHLNPSEDCSTCHR
jgi:hypothetical protein